MNASSDSLPNLKWPEAFAKRVFDAKLRILAEQPIEEIRALHGSVVIRAAVEQISKTFVKRERV